MPYTAEKPHKPDTRELASRIKGWGVDLDPKNRPAYPKEKRPPGGTGAHWVIPEQQEAKIRIFRSTEHQRLTPVFGTSCPPHGLSGRLRAVAYDYSEGRLSHWLLLLLADRVDMVESMLGGLLRGKPDNVLAEIGIKSELKRGAQRSRFGQHRADVGNRIPKELLLVLSLGAGAAVASLSARRKSRAA